jgi:hypothetical protein
VPAPFPKVLGDGVSGKAAIAFNRAFIRVSKTLFSYQIFVVAETTPGVDFILHDCRTRAGNAGPSRAEPDQSERAGDAEAASDTANAPMTKK